MEDIEGLSWISVIILRLVATKIHTVIVKMQTNASQPLPRKCLANTPTEKQANMAINKSIIVKDPFSFPAGNRKFWRYFYKFRTMDIECEIQVSLVLRYYCYSEC